MAVDDEVVAGVIVEEYRKALTDGGSIGTAEPSVWVQLNSY
jgi:hypothetical protein